METHSTLTHTYSNNQFLTHKLTRRQQSFLSKRVKDELKLEEKKIPWLILTDDNLMNTDET